MALSNELITQLVKATTDDKKEVRETTVYAEVTNTDHEKGIYARFDGADDITPVVSTTDVAPGDRVIVTIKNHTATITGNLSSPSAKSETVQNVSNKVDAVDIVVTDLVVENGRIDQLETNSLTVGGKLSAYKADIDNLKAKDVEITGRLEAAEAVVEDVKAENVTISGRVTANEGFIKDLEAHKLDADEAEMTYAKIEIVDSSFADIRTLIFGSATGDVIHTSFANSVIAQLGDAQIKSAMIDSVTADSITAGTIFTDYVTITSEDCTMMITDGAILISDESGTPRVQMGKDASNDYSLNIWDASGNIMFSEGGITDSAIKEAIIRNDMISDTANIAAHKLDIDSLFTEINGSDKTIKSTRVYLDDKKQTLDVSFKSLETNVSSLSNDVSSHGTQISAIQGQISSKIWQQDIDTATDAMTTKYTSLEQNLSKFETTVSGTYAKNESVTSLGTRVTQTENGISAQASQITSLGSRVNTVELAADGLTMQLNNMQVGGRNYLTNAKRLNNFMVLTGSPTINVNHADCPNGVYLVGEKGDLSSVRLSNAITSNGYWTISFELRGSQSATPGFKLDICDYDPVLFKATADNQWVKHSLTVNVTNYTADRYNFIDFANISWAYIFIRNIKIEKGTKATDWTPAPEDVINDISAAGKTATNYLNYSTAGLVVGDHTASSLGNNVLIDSSAVKVRTGTTVNSVFGADLIELAKNNTSATISMLNGAFKIYYDADNSDGGFGIYGKTSSGQERLAFQAVNENDNLTIGWGGYAAKANSTNIYGHKIYLTTNDDIILNPGSGDIEVDGNMNLTNGKNIFGKNTSGALRSMAMMNASNQMVFGYGSYTNSEGNVFYEGNIVSLMSKGDISMTPGSENVKIDGSVVLTNGKNLFGTNASGTARSLAILNASNQMLFGYGSYSNSEGSVFYDGNNVTVRSKNDITFQTPNEKVALEDNSGGTTYSAFFRPESNGKCTLGLAAKRWYAVYATNGTVQTSDAREKENIVSLGDIHSELFDRLNPVQYNFINGNGKICYGLISQEVIESMEALGIGEHDLDLVHHDIFVDDNGERQDTFGITYTNLIAMLIHEVQKLKTELKMIKIA